MIKISKKIQEEMIAHANAGFPNEACGILAGDLKKGSTSHFFPMKNLDESSISYFMDPKEQLLFLKKSETRGLR